MRKKMIENKLKKKKNKDIKLEVIILLNSSSTCLKKNMLIKNAYQSKV